MGSETKEVVYIKGAMNTFLEVRIGEEQIYVGSAVEGIYLPISEMVKQ